MNRAWMLRMEQRMENLERKLKALGELLEALKSVPEPDPVKRGPGRPPKAAE